MSLTDRLIRICYHQNQEFCLLDRARIDVYFSERLLQ